MKHLKAFPFFLSLFLFIAAIYPTPLSAKEIVADSKLTAATVYTNRAKLTRRAIINLPAGAHTIIFKDLPAGIFSDSFQTEGAARVNVTLGAVSYKLVAGRDLAAPREKELNEKLMSLKDSKNLIGAEKQALQSRKTFLQNLGKQAALRTNEDIAEINLKPEQWAAAADTIHTGISEILKRDLALNIKIRGLDEEIKRINTELQQLRTGQRNVWQVSIPVETAAPTKLALDLNYQIGNATWKPLYDARLDTKDGTVELIQYGSVTQRTGEDWTDIALTLSTAQPHRGAGLPALGPMWVNVYKDGRRGKFASSPAQNYGGATRQSVMMESDDILELSEAAVPMKTRASVISAQIETGGFVSEYIIPGPSSVLADGTESKLMIGPFKTQSSMQIHIKPQLSNQAFLVAKTKLQGDAPILSGQVNLFRDSSYVGQTHIPLLRPGQEKILPFGIDDQVSVLRRVMKDEKDSSGIISRDRELERHFIRKLHNLHKDTIEVVVLETIPVAKDKRITIDILKDVTTQGYELDSDDIKGLLRWTFNMSAKEEKDIKLGWKVSWPEDHSISGL